MSATKQVPPEVLFIHKKARQKIAYRTARKILKFPTIIFLVYCQK